MTPQRYKDWLSVAETRRDVAALGPARRLLAVLDDKETLLEAGDPLPPLWHWIYFLPGEAQSDLGPDGHPRRGGFLPPVELPRRMFAGGSLILHAPVPLGAEMRREAAVVDLKNKTGRSGRLIFVTVRFLIYSRARLCLEEEQAYVYQKIGPPLKAPQPLREWPPPPAGAQVRLVHFDPVLLFRFSALVFNAHRIHYDRAYATDEEGYPGLVVHGPLVALMLAELVRRRFARTVRAFKFRSTAPFFDSTPARLVAVARNSNLIELTAERIDGVKALLASAELA